MVLFWLLVAIMVVSGALILLDNNYKNLNEKLALRFMLVLGFLALFLAWLLKTLMS